MSRIWTGDRRRRAGAARNRAPRAAVCACALLALACGKNKTTDLIKPVTASATIEAVSASPPYIFVTNPQSSGDLVTVEVMLRPSGSATFDAYDLEFSYDPRLVQPELVEDNGPVTPFPTATASSGAVCNDASAVCAGTTVLNPLCASSFSNAAFLFGASVNTGSGCLGTTVTGDTHLLTIGLQATTVGTSLIEIAPPGRDSCAILNAASPVPGVGCYGRITLTATR
jgi:hypothetical protein